MKKLNWGIILSWMTFFWVARNKKWYLLTENPIQRRLKIMLIGPMLILAPAFVYASASFKILNEHRKIIGEVQVKQINHELERQ